jgi:hypothetical protein
MSLQKDKFELMRLTIDLTSIIQGCLNAFPKQSCDFNLSNLFTWGHLYKLHYFIWKGSYVIYNPRYHYLAFPFCYSFRAEELAGLVKEFREIDPKTEMILFPEDWLHEHPEATQFFRFRWHPAWSDYVYLTEKLVNLPGRKLAKKKNLISQFLRKYPDYEVHNIVKSDEKDILRQYEQWQSDRQIREIGLTLEYRAVKKAFELWDDLPLDGLKILLNNEVIAWSVFSPQTADMVTVHFEKFDPLLKGCAQIINWETAKYMSGKYKYINREQDMGLEGLKQAKRSYEPEFMVEFVTSRLK